ncbi:hypothetical protein ScPMuIL_016905 [Solemya velum]
MATRTEQGLFPDALFKFDHLERPIQQHLQKVYSCLAISMLTATAGAYLHLFTDFSVGNFLSAIISLGLMIWLASTHHSKETEGKRLAIFAGFTFFSGMSLGPLLDYVIQVDPSIIPTALLGTFVVFVSFSLTALFNTDRTFLYMGGALVSGLSMLCLLGLMNIFMGSQLLYDIQLYLGLAVFCAFILYDTQLIVEKRRNGDVDYIWHSVDLFIDFIGVFRRLLVLLSKKEEKKRK